MWPSPCPTHRFKRKIRPHRRKTKERDALYRRWRPPTALSKALLCRRALRDFCIVHQSDCQLITNLAGRESSRHRLSLSFNRILIQVKWIKGKPCIKTNKNSISTIWGVDSDQQLKHKDSECITEKLPTPSWQLNLNTLHTYCATPRRRYIYLNPHQVLKEWDKKHNKMLKRWIN